MSIGSPVLKAGQLETSTEMAQCISVGKQLEVDAAEIRIRAERRVGELIAAQKAQLD